MSENETSRGTEIEGKPRRKRLRDIIERARNNERACRVERAQSGRSQGKLQRGTIPWREAAQPFSRSLLSTPRDKLRIRGKQAANHAADPEKVRKLLESNRR